ncbi:hypothetical protein HZS_6811 [Henneguya salminicola]|nr:hypothetical protein HZS_6811 [Henneguya salminicola]
MAFMTKLMCNYIVLKKCRYMCVNNDCSKSLRMFSPSGHYATALFRAAKSQDNLDDIHTDLNIITDLVRKDSFFFYFSRDITMSNSTKKGDKNSYI